MIVCTCGERHDDATEWCTCGRYVGFDERLPDTDPVSAPPDSVTDATPTDATPGASAAGTQPPHAPTVPSTPPRPDTPDAVGPTVHQPLVKPPRPVDRDEPTGPVDVVDDRRLTIRGDSVGDTPHIKAEIPGEVRDRPGDDAPEFRYSARADDVLCENCSTRNPNDRTFCRFCTHELGTPAIQTADPVDLAPKEPWYRRLVARVRGRGRTAGPSGAKQKAQKAKFAAFRARSSIGRARGLGFRARGFRSALLMALGGGAIVALVPGLRGPAIDSAQFAARPDNYRYVSVTSALTPPAAIVPGWEPWMIGDNSQNRAWAFEADFDGPLIAEAPSDGACVVGQGSVVVSFADGDTDSVDLDRVAVWAGWDGDDARETRPRPKLLQIRFDGPEPHCAFVALEDSPDRQSRKIGARDVTSAEISVLDVYPGQGEDTLVAIAEVWWEQEK